MTQKNTKCAKKQANVPPNGEGGEQTIEIDSQDDPDVENSRQGLSDRY